MNNRVAVKGLIEELRKEFELEDKELEKKLKKGKK